MTKVIILDSGPLGLLTQRLGVPDADACRRWLASRTAAGDTVVVPEIADYEIRRELLRAKKAAGIARLDLFNLTPPVRYVPITTGAMRRAAELWALARHRGTPTADPKKLDADVILAAQALTMGVPPAQFVVATTNVSHLSLFLKADLWKNL